MSATSRRNKKLGTKTTARKRLLPCCPKCGERATHGGDGHYYCRGCRLFYDDDPGEGGDYANDPTKRLEREERRATDTHG